MEASTEQARHGSEKSSDKRKKIVDAAIQVFAEKGYHGSRISDIAREAEIAYGLVYHYFKNKEEILDTIFLERWAQFIETVRAIADDGRAVEEKLLSIAAVILSAYRNRPEWVKVLVFELQRTQRFADADRVAVVGELYGLIERILREGQERGELRAELDPAIASYIFVGGINVFVTSSVLEVISVEGDEGSYFVKVARTVVDLFLNGAGLPAGTNGGMA